MLLFWVWVWGTGSVWNGNKNVLPDAFLEGISVGFSCPF